MIAHALALGALLMADAGTSGAERMLAPPKELPGAPFAWLLGRWTGSGYLCCLTDLRLDDGKLFLRRVQGPQHGAAVEQDYQFERAP